MKNTNRLIALAALFMTGVLAVAPRPAAAQQGESLAAILKDLQTYDTSDTGPAMRLHAYVFAHKDDAAARRAIEAALIAFVQGAAAPAGLMAACRSLSLLGGPDAVPILAELALKPETTDAARYALERIPGPEADQSLLGALDKAAGAVRRGVVSSLGARKSAAAVPALARLAAGKDAALAADAVKALGKIGGPEAIKALVAALVRAPAGLKSDIASALLAAAESAAVGGDRAGATAVYDKVYAANVSPAMRRAAFQGRIAASPDPKSLILKALAGKDASLYEPALALVAGNFGPDEIGKVVDLTDKLPVPAQVQMTALLAHYPAETARPYLLKAAESPSPEVRSAALRALTEAGDGKAVLFLANKAARTAGAEQDAAREALARMKGLDVDAAVLEHLGKAGDDAVKAELVRAAGARRLAGAKTALMALVASGAPGLKARAAAALRTMAVQGDIPALLDLLGGLEDETAREALQDTVAAAARTNPRELARAGEVEARLGAVKDPKKKADLLRVLGKIGDDSALPLVRAARGDAAEAVADAAVRALADWPTPAARDDVFDVSRTALVLNHRVLAMRAYIRMIGLEPYRSPEGAAADLLKVLALSPRPEEKKLVLGLLGRFPCVTSLKAAESLLADPTVAAEAKLAADRIRNTLK
ncbi:MAG: HEAT repeat domain-containing protein [Acidobacteria bacterium]|jgi:HEAT repeat protein|nr:HEAT repeat domain-containing protein [Acidobacteriota bacterium]